MHSTKVIVVTTTKVHGKHIQLLLYYLLQLRGQLARVLLMLVRWPCVAHTLVGLETATYRYSLTGRHWPLLYLDRDCPHSFCSVFMSTDTLTSFPLLELRCGGGGRGGRMKRRVVHYTSFRFVCTISIWIKVFFKLMFPSDT